MKAVIYCRVSSTNDRQNTDRQVFDLTNYAKQNNIKVEKVFSEKISGGVKNSDRTILNECLAYAESEKIDMVLFSEMSRCGRKILEVLETIKWLADHKIQAYFQKENMRILNEKGEIDPITSVIISCLSFCSEIERENIKFRLQSGLHLYKENGGKLGRHVGYRKPKEEKREQYANVIKLLHQGYSVRKTAKLCDVGYSTVQRIKKEFADEIDL